MMKQGLRIVAGVCLGFLVGCAGRAARDGAGKRVREVPEAARVKAVAVEYVKGMWPRFQVQDIMPVTHAVGGKYLVWIWNNTNVPGGFVTVEVSTNFEAVGWRPGQ